jgi:LmbE family N-acetylglucosaminyl deacetylase
MSELVESTGMPSALPDRYVVTPAPVFGGDWERMLGKLGSVPPMEALAITPGETVVVVAAHPDDETFGVGATLAQLSLQGVRVHVLSLTTGEAALDHVGVEIAGLAERRRTEFGDAAARLGLASATVLNFPDGRLAEFESESEEVIGAALALHAAARLLTVWWGDPHPDHQAAGRAGRRAGADAGIAVSGFPIWAPHWLDPRGTPLESGEVTRLETTETGRDAKARAIGEYRSQTEPLASYLEPVLPSGMTRWPHEMLIRG